MKTIFSTGPGYYAASSRKTSKKIPPGKVWVFVTKLECYEVDQDNSDVTFEHICSVASRQNDKSLASKALLDLRDVISSNEEDLRKNIK